MTEPFATLEFLLSAFMSVVARVERVRSRQVESDCEASLLGEMQACTKHVKVSMSCLLHYALGYLTGRMLCAI